MTREQIAAAPALPTLYVGNDTYGRALQVARASDGRWFRRFYEYNGYGMTWTRWRPYACDVTDIPASIEYGFQRLAAVPGARLRLPSAK
jgi:hypothetical protein